MDGRGDGAEERAIEIILAVKAAAAVAIYTGASVKSIIWLNFAVNSSLLCGSMATVRSSLECAIRARQVDGTLIGGEFSTSAFSIKVLNLAQPAVPIASYVSKE